jgi:anti-sigma factor RsiW
MKPVDPAEISALLDGELPPSRAAEVRRAIAQSDSLRRAYEQLAAIDVDLKAYAAKAVFHPQLWIAEKPSGRDLRLLGVALLLLAVRLAVKVVPASIGLGLESVVLVLVVGWLLHRLVGASEEDRRRLLEQIAASPA